MTASSARFATDSRSRTPAHRPTATSSRTSTARAVFRREDYAKSIRECTLTTYYNVRDALQKRRTELYKGVMALDVLIYYCERMNGDYLPEKMSEDEAFKFIQERCQKEGIGTLKLGGDVGRTGTV